MNRSRRGIISSDGVMSSIAPTTCSRTYRTARVPWRRRVCESRTAPRATPCHENHARCCVWVSLCGSDLRFTMFTFSLQRTDATNRFGFVLRFDFKIVCGCGCVSAPKPFVPFSRSLNGSSLRSNLWFELRFSPETPNPFNTMKRVEPNNDNSKHNEIQ